MGTRLSILIYHRVLPEPLQPDLPDARQFATQMRALSRWFRAIPLKEAVVRLREGSLPAGAACITFDDGYADNCEVALPILRNRGLAATFVVATGYIDGGRMWNDTVIEAVRCWPEDTVYCQELELPAMPVASYEDKRSALSRIIKHIKHQPSEQRLRIANALGSHLDKEGAARLMMASSDVASMYRQGMTIGAHTRSHPILTRISHRQARDEVEGSRRDLEALIDAPVRLFAFPNGRPGQDYNGEHVRFVKELGFQAAVSTAYGVAGPKSDLYQLPRFTSWDVKSGRFVARLCYTRFASRLKGRALQGAMAVGCGGD